MQGEILSVRESAAPCGRPSVNLLLTVLYVSSTLPLSAVDAQRAGWSAQQALVDQATLRL